MSDDLEQLSPEARVIVDHLRMQKIPHEGPWFAPSYRSDDALEGAAALRYDSERVVCSSIHALMTSESFSAMHRLGSDELWHFHAGAPLALLLLHANGAAEDVIIGPKLLAGHHAQYTVHAGTWIGAKPLGDASHDWSLIGNVVTPGFEYADYEAGIREQLIAQWPTRAADIRILTRES